MPVQCRLVDPFPGWDKLQPGDMWHYGRDRWEEGEAALRAFFTDLSPEYFRDNVAQRPPLAVMLPSGDGFNIDTCCSRKEYGWTVTGEPPAITVQPSINAEGSYHGWLQNGVLSDDVEGRTYP